MSEISTSIMDTKDVTGAAHAFAWWVLRGSLPTATGPPETQTYLPRPHDNKYSVHSK